MLFACRTALRLKYISYAIYKESETLEIRAMAYFNRIDSMAGLDMDGWDCGGIARIRRGKSIVAQVARRRPVSQSRPDVKPFEVGSAGLGSWRVKCVKAL